MELVIGIALALFIGAAAARLGMDRDRAFYPAVLIVVASYYVLFATLAGDPDALWPEIAVAAAFVIAAVAGFKRSPWLVVGALAAHGVMDFFHHAIVRNPGVPGWWPGFCAAYDLTAAALLGGLLAYRANRHLSRLGSR